MISIIANTPLKALIQRICLVYSYDRRGCGKTNIWAQAIDLYVYNEYEEYDSTLLEHMYDAIR